MPLVSLVPVYGSLRRQHVERREPQIFDAVHRPAVAPVGLGITLNHGGALLIPGRQGLDGHPALGGLV
jgi:hypothetical protein